MTNDDDTAGPTMAELLAPRRIKVHQPRRNRGGGVRRVCGCGAPLLRDDGPVCRGCRDRLLPHCRRAKIDVDQALAYFAPLAAAVTNLAPREEEVTAWQCIAAYIKQKKRCAYSGACLVLELDNPNGAVPRPRHYTDAYNATLQIVARSVLKRSMFFLD
jgi:hypothetical protein